MLIEFIVENFRSIKERVTLSLVASPDKSLDNNLIEQKALSKDKLLKSALIYGANASGKTNLLLALNFLQALVMKSHTHQKGSKIRFNPFKMEKGCLKKPTKFEIVFIKNGTKYIYGLSFDEEKIINEYLYYYPENRKALIFERSNTNKYKFTIDKKLQDFLSEKTPENVLYLSRSIQLNYKRTAGAFDWFKDNLRVIGPTESLQPDYTASLLKDPKLKKTILRALLEADVGIDDVSATVKKISADDLPSDIPDEIKSIIISSKFKGEEVKIRTSHKNTPFEFNEESDGTRRIFSLIGPWIDALKNGRILVVDELDTKLHHLLNVFLINLFHNTTQNKSNAQLIFTTHNVNLLDQEIFRRDQVWFTEKKSEFGDTDLYSLVEFSPRKDKNIQKGYLAGRYGAIPFIKEGSIF
ncbi:ATP-binding protein [Candidatus Woesearchaeota archaeon]|nr:ATP-binding protein [Candidatus Woesearchaeota archaeon]